MDVAGFALLWRLVGGVFGVFYFCALEPAFDADGPFVEGFGGVAGGVEFFVAVEAEVEEVAGEVFHEGPFAGGVGDDEGDLVGAEEGDEVGGFEGGVADFDGVAEGAIFVDLKPSAAFHEGSMFFGEFGGFFRVAREFVEEALEAVGVEFEVGGKLPRGMGRVFLSAASRPCP